MTRWTVRGTRALLWVVHAWVSFALVLLVTTFLLELFGAQSSAGFVTWVYRSVERTMAPFRGIFEPVDISGRSTLDTSVLFAAIVYGFAAFWLRVAVDAMTRRLAHHEPLDRKARTVSLSGPAGLSASAVLRPILPDDR